MTSHHINKTLFNIIKLSYIVNINYFNDNLVKVSEIIEFIEKLSWFNDLSKSEIKKVNVIIFISKRLTKSLKDHHLNDDQKSVIYDLEEVCQDLESKFFTLPQIDGFKDVTKGLENL